MNFFIFTFLYSQIYINVSVVGRFEIWLWFFNRSGPMAIVFCVWTMELKRISRVGVWCWWFTFLLIIFGCCLFNGYVICIRPHINLFLKLILNKLRFPVLFQLNYSRKLSWSCTKPSKHIESCMSLLIQQVVLSKLLIHLLLLLYDEVS